MSDCRICGNELREGEDTLEVDGHQVHVDCASAHFHAEPPHKNTFASFGVPQQMALGDVQHEP